VATEERRVSATLEVKKEGDTAAFREAAEDVKNLASTTGVAGDEILEFYIRLANAQDKFSHAISVGDTKLQADALKDMALAWAVAVPPDLDLSFRRVGTSIRELTADLLETEDAQGALGSSSRELAREYLGVSDAVKRLEESTRGSFVGATQRVSEARVELNNYTRALEDAKRAGADLGEGEIAQLEQLEGRYRSAVEAVGRYEAAKKQAKREIDASAAATDRELSSVRSLDDLLKRAAPSWAHYVVNAGSVIAVFGVAYAAGSKLRDVFNDLTDGSFDRFLQKTSPVLIAWNKLVDIWATSGPNAAGRLERQLELLRKNGIDPTGLSAEEVSAKVDELGKALQRGGHATSEAKFKHEAYATALTESEREIGEQIAALDRFVTKSREVGDLITPDQVAGIKERIREFLAQYDTLSEGGKAKLRELAAQWGVLTAAEEQALERHKELVAEYLEAITGAAAGSREQLEAEAAAMVVALESIDFDRIKGTQPKVFANLQEQIEEMLSKFRESGQLIPDELGKWANAAGVVVHQWELMGTAAVEAAGKVGQGTTRIVETVDEAGNKVRQIVQDFGSAGAAGQAAGEQAAQGQVRIVETVDEAGNKVRQIVQDFGSAGAAGEAAGDQAAQGQLKVIEKIDETGKKTREIVQVFEEAGAAGEEGGKKAGTFFDEITVSAKDGTAAVRETATAARDAAEGLGEAAQGAGDLGAAAATTDHNLGSLDERLTSIEDRLGTAETALHSIAEQLPSLGPAFASAFESGLGSLDQLNTGLDATGRKVATLLAQLADLQQGQAAAPAAPPGGEVN
jgi:hypothetical protein